MNSTMRRILGTCRWTHTIVGASRTSITATVSTASSSDRMMAPIRSGSLPMPFQASKVRAQLMAVGVSRGRELEHGEQRQEQVAADDDEDDPARGWTGTSSGGRRPDAHVRHCTRHFVVGAGATRRWP